MNRLIQDCSTPLLYLITDRKMLPRQSSGSDLAFLIDFINRAVAAGVDMVQVRERDLPARDIAYLTETVAKSARPAGVRVLVNDRADIAACAADGVHLTTRSLTADVVRRAFGPDMLIGVSTHNFDEASAAARGGADFIVFGPVFETVSKKAYGEPVGVEALRETAARLSIPVLALGGISLSNFHEVLDAGAAGVAGISMFTGEPDLASVVNTIKRRDGK